MSLVGTFLSLVIARGQTITNPKPPETLLRLES